MIKVKIYGPKGPRVAKLPLDKSSLGRDRGLPGSIPRQRLCR